MEKNPGDRLSSSEALDIISADARGSDDQRELANIYRSEPVQAIQFIKEIVTHRSTKARGNFRRLFIEDDRVLENQPNRLPLAEGSCASQAPGDLCGGGSLTGSALSEGFPFTAKRFPGLGQSRLQLRCRYSRWLRRR